MKNKNLTIDDLIVKTEEALIGAGLSPHTVWTAYHMFFRRIRLLFFKEGKQNYDFSCIEKYILQEEKEYNAQRISRHQYLMSVRSAKVLVTYADNGKILTSVLQRGTKFKLNENYEIILSEYLASKGYIKNTADDVEWAIRRFLYFLQQINHVSLSSIAEEHARRFVVLMSEQYSTGTLKNILCYLSSFCSYAYEKNYLTTDISKVFRTTIHRENRIYPALSDEEVNLIMSKIDTNTDMGKRDYAMLMLGVSIGLRAIDIINLRLQDINWIRGEIHLVQRKTGQAVFLPLMPDAGKAIADYILNARPQSRSEYIFLTTKYPIHKFNDETGMAYIFNKYAKLAGIHRTAYDGKSFHALRRRVATKMVIAGIPVTTVSQVLGQSKMNSAQQYLSFDTENLRQCAIGFSGIEVSGGIFNG